MKVKLKQLIMIAFMLILVVVPVSTKAYVIQEHVYSDGTYRGPITREITGYNPINWNGTTFTFNNNYNGITAPLKIYCQRSATTLNGAEHMFFGRLWWDNEDGGSMIDKSNTFYYISSGYNNNIVTNGYYVSSDYDQFYLKKPSGGVADSGNFIWDGHYTRTSTTVKKVYNDKIGNVPSNTVTKQWGTTTELPNPTMTEFTISLNLMDSTGTPAECSQNELKYRYIYDGMYATVTGATNSDPDTTGVYASSQGLTSGSVSNTHANTIYYYGVKGTLSVPAIAKAQGDIGPSSTSCTFTAYYSRDAITLPTPTRPGYTFDGWYLNSSYTGTKYNGGQSYFGVSSSAKPNATAPAGSFVLYAKWTPITYNVSFDVNAPKDYNGNSRIGQIINIPSNTTVTFDNTFKASTPTLKGYIFNGWYISNMTTNSKVTKKYGFNTPPENTFASNSSTAYYACGPVVSNGNIQSSNMNSYLNLQDENKTVYFKARTGNSSDGPGWTPIKYTVSLDPNAGTINGNPNSYDFVMEYDKGFQLPTPTREGYSFAGWQIYSYSGKSDYASWVNTNTNPLTAGTVNRMNGGSTQYNLCYTEGSSIKLVAIWKHEHATPNISDVSLDHANPYIYLTSNDPTGFSNVCYYINTNYENIKNMEFNGFTINSSNWYKVTSYGLKVFNKGGNISAPEQTALTIIGQPNAVFPYITKNTDKIKLAINENAYANVSPCVNVKCTWEDHYSKCAKYNENQSYLGNKVTIIGDCEKPSLKDIEKLEELEAIDLREVDEYLVKLIAKDDENPSKVGNTVYYPSGIKTSEFKIINSDNYVNKVLSYTNYRKNGIITSIEYEPFDLAIRHDMDEDDDSDGNLFNGTCDFTYFYADNVGNIYTNTDKTSIFYLDTELSSFTYTPTNMTPTTKAVVTHEGIENKTVPSFKKGEAALLEVTTMGYADALKIDFPDEWYIDEDYPIYMYWGDTASYEDKKLEKITSDVFYIDTTGKADVNGYWTENFIFMVPLYADSKDFISLNDSIKVTAYKGEGITVSPDHDKIEVNHGGFGGALETLEDTQAFHINDESVLDDYRDSIIKTYRGNGLLKPNN